MKVSLTLATAATSLLASVGQAIVLPQLVQHAFEVLDEEQPLPFAESENLAFPKPHVPYFLKPIVESEKLQDKIELDDLNATVSDLFEIAKASNKSYGNPTRVIGSPGHWKTINYILKQFDDMRDYYDVSLQAVGALTGKVFWFNLTDAETGETFANSKALSLSPPVRSFVGELVSIPNLGCEEADFETVTPPPPFEKQKKKIALIERGQCPFGVKSDLAGKFGYHAVVIFDNEPKAKGGLQGTLGNPTNNTVSTIGVTYETGKTLIKNILLRKNYSLRFGMDSFVKNIWTKNIIVDTKHGDENNIVMLGAHSDSVEDGPGINDDGSGTASLLAVAKQLTHFKINNKVRFAWWAAEEEGLVGSNFYANNLTKEENQKIRLFMDYDMMASPNYQYEIYNANNVDNPNGSEELRDLYIDYYKAHNLSYALVDFDGRSDYVGFIENSIPAGGIATGAEGKNPTDGNPFDSCYHLLCDDVSNLAWDAFLVNTKLIAHSIATYANSLEDFPIRENATIKSTEAMSKLEYRGDHLII